MRLLEINIAFHNIEATNSAGQKISYYKQFVTFGK